MSALDLTVIRILRSIRARKAARVLIMRQDGALEESVILPGDELILNLEEDEEVFVGPE